MASSAVELTAVLANLVPVVVSRRVLCPHRSGFEGGGIVVGRPAAVAGRFEGAIDGGGGRTRHSGGCGDVLSPRTPTVSGMSSQHSAWRCSCRDDCTGLIAIGMTDPAILTSQRGPV
jgi:hypothetical protein